MALWHLNIFHCHEQYAKTVDGTRHTDAVYKTATFHDLYVLYGLGIIVE